MRLDEIKKLNEWERGTELYMYYKIPFALKDEFKEDANNTTATKARWDRDQKMWYVTVELRDPRSPESLADFRPTELTGRLFDRKQFYAKYDQYFHHASH